MLRIYVLGGLYITSDSRPLTGAAGYAHVAEVWVRADPILAGRVATARQKASVLRGSH